jgi:hypothetical protein
MSITTAIECLSRANILCFANSLRAAIESSIRDPVNAFISAIDALSAGASMLIDDIMDVGKFDRVHHWMWGVILIIVGIIVLAVTVVLLLTKPF